MRISDWSSDVCSSDLGDITRGDGYITNINTGNTLGDKNSRSGRATILFTPTDTIENVTVVKYDRVKGTEGAGKIINYTSAPTTPGDPWTQFTRSEEHTSELQSTMRISIAACSWTKNTTYRNQPISSNQYH